MPKEPKQTSKTPSRTAVRPALRLTRSQITKFLSSVPEECVFWSNDGRILHDMTDLKDALSQMTDETYSYHSNAVKNDFSNWVRNIIGDEQLASDMEKAYSRAEAARIVEERYILLMNKAG